MSKKSKDRLRDRVVTYTAGSRNLTLEFFDMSVHESECSNIGGENQTHICCTLKYFCTFDGGGHAM